MSKKTLKAFRLEEKTVALVVRVAKKNGMDQTQVIEECLARYAAEIPEFKKEAEAVLAQLAFELAHKSLAARTRGDKCGRKDEHA